MSSTEYLVSKIKDLRSKIQNSRSNIQYLVTHDYWLRPQANMYYLTSNFHTYIYICISTQLHQCGRNRKLQSERSNWPLLSRRYPDTDDYWRLSQLKLHDYPIIGFSDSGAEFEKMRQSAVDGLGLVHGMQGVLGLGLRNQSLGRCNSSVEVNMSMLCARTGFCMLCGVRARV